MAVSIPGNSCNPCRGATTIQGCLMRLSGECVYYSGSAISGPGINPGDNLNTLIVKLANWGGGGGTTFTAENGLNLTATVLKWGGPLTGFTQITGDSLSEQIFFTGISTQTLGTWQDAFFQIQTADDPIFANSAVALGVNAPTGTGGTGIWIEGGDTGINITDTGNSVQTGININSAGTGINVSSSGTNNNNTAIFASTPFGTTAHTIRATQGGTGRAVYAETTSQTGTPFQAHIQATSASLTPVVAIFSLDNNFMAPQNSGLAIDIRPKTNTGLVDAFQTRIVSKMTNASGNISQTEIWGIQGSVGLTPTYSQSLSIWHFNGGKVGIGNTVTSPTARLHLPAGTAVVNMAPLKFTSGPLLPTPENGCMEYDGTNYYLTIGTTRSQISLGANTNFYTTNGTLTSTRTVTCANFGVTWSGVGTFRITNGDATTGGIYDFNTGVNYMSYNASNSSNFILDPVTGLTFERTSLPGNTVLSGITVDDLGVKLTGIQEFASQLAATTAGLTSGYLFRDSAGALQIVI